jgi:hypothetical protein
MFYHTVPMSDIVKNILSKSSVTVLQLRKLLFDLNEKRPDVCIRFRMIGELWMSSFSRVSSVTDKGVILTTDHSNRVILVPNLNNVMQFELDNNFQEFTAHNHYNVVLDQD